MNLRPYDEESFKYAHRRRTFGKPLIEHPVIRAKLADMVGRCRFTVSKPVLKAPTVSALEATT